MGRRSSASPSVAGITALWFVARSARLDRLLSWAIPKDLHRWTDLDTSDYGHMLHLAEAYAIGEVAVAGIVAQR